MTIPYQLSNKIKKLSSKTIDNDLSILRGKPFWIFDNSSHRLEFINTNGKCCFWHIVGLPEKNDKKLPLFDYEELLYDSLQESKYLFCVKAPA